MLRSALLSDVKEAESGGLKPREFERIRRLAYEKFGLDLRHGKEELVCARLGKLIRRGGFGSFEQYYRHVIEDSSGDALTGMIDALSTNFTSFLREPAHFEFMVKTVLPQWRDRTEIRIWSAACSSGEEPYSIAFTLLENIGPAAYGSLRLLATDISTRVLDVARRGVYPAERLQDLPRSWLPGYLLRGHGSAAGYYKVKPEVQRLVDFRRLNLIEPFSHPQPFAAIFCRNVMIYFDKPTQKDLVARLGACLENGGYLFVGHAESLAGVQSDLDYIRPAVYRKPAGLKPRPGSRRSRS
jgi:chemotaxis protein methyltransferase CheR